MGGSAGKNKSKSSSNMSQDVWGGQDGALGNLYNNAEGLYNQQNNGKLGGIADGLGGFNQGVMDGAMGGYNDQLGGGAFGDTSDVRAKLMGSMGQPSQTGQMYNDIIGGQGNSYIDPQVDAMKQGANQNLDRMTSGTALDAAAMGQGGGSRQAMQNAMTNQLVNQDMMNQETNMRGNAYDKDLNWKMNIAQQADGNRQLEQDRMMGMLGGANQSQQFGMGSGQGLQQIGMGSMAPEMQAQNQGWNNMNNYSGTIGRPTVLSSGGQSGSSKGGGGGASAKG